MPKLAEITKKHAKSLADAENPSSIKPKERYSKTCRLLEEALTLMSEWGT